MVFSSTIFLFLFLPLLLPLYLLAGRWGRNYVLLLGSLFFYYWGETVYVLLMLFSISINYGFGLLIDARQHRGKDGRIFLIAALCLNIGLLAFFKYANFFIDNLNTLTMLIGISPVEMAPVHLPIGISFFTFQAMSYVVDLYRGEVKAEKNPFNVALYISLFPQLIAGPIVRYHDISQQIRCRQTRLEDIVSGSRRFIIGLGKKVLIANVLGRTADYIFSLPTDRVPMGLAWIGACAYTLQIYYDFSGYSDMAIGLGRMFGFHFLENFQYPYTARSIREFWRRWHISLSTWFRDYLYIPLGGSRGSAWRTRFNLITVFFLCGLWHGASWTFVTWGLFHGLFLALERTPFGSRLLPKTPRPLRHLYVMLVVIAGWVIFRADNISYGVSYIGAMCNPLTPFLYNSQIFLCINNEFWFIFIIAIIASAPVYRLLESGLQNMTRRSLPLYASIIKPCAYIANTCFLALVLVYSIASILGGAYNPFLYFRF